MKYTDLLKKHGINVEELSRKIRKMIDEYNVVSNAVAQGKEELKTNKSLKPEEKTELQGNIAASENSLKDLDAGISKALEAWLPNREKYAAAVKKMTDGRLQKAAAKKNAATPPKQDPPKQDPPKQDPPKQDPPKQDPPKQDPPKQDPPKQDPPANNPPADDKKKGKFPWGTVILGVAILGITLGAVNIMKDRK